MYPVRGDEREAAAPPWWRVGGRGAVGLLRASSIIDSAPSLEQPVHQPFLQREAGRYATGIADAFGARGRVSGRRHSHRSVDLGGGRQVRTAHRRRSALPALLRSDRPRVPGAGRHHVHQSRRTRPRHTRADGRTRPDQRSVALRGGARRPGAQDHRDQIQAAFSGRSSRSDAYAIRRCRGGAELSAAKSELWAYVVYVGFDEIGDKNEKKPAKSARKLAPRPQ